MPETAKPLTAKGRATRDRIVEAAGSLMLARGVEGTSVDAVLEAAGAGKSQLYHYFGDKDGLVHAVVAYRDQTVIGPQVDALAAVLTWDDLREWFSGVADHQAATGCREGCPVGSLAAELSERDEDSRQVLAAAFERWERHFAMVLDRFQSAGLLSERADTAALASMTLATVQGALLVARTTHDEPRLRAALNQAFLHVQTHALD